MKKFVKTVIGVTLLEVMLVLAIAAMIIVMSVRYYQTATNNQQANAVLQMVQGITAAADGVSQAAGSYSAASESTIKSLMPNQNMKTPWGAEIKITGNSGSVYTVTIPSTPAAVCTLLRVRLSSNTKYSNLATCTGSVIDFSYVYDSTL